MLRDVFDLIVDLWRAPDIWIATEMQAALPRVAPDVAVADASFRRQYLDLARQRQRANGQLVCGLVTLEWKVSRLQTFGARYSEMKLVTSMVGELVLGQMADRPDFVLQYDADNFVVCFASASPLVPELRLAMMAQALEAALSQRIPDLGDRLGIRTLVAGVDPALPVRQSGDIAAGLMASLLAIRERLAGGPLPAMRRAGKTGSAVLFI